MSSGDLARRCGVTAATIRRHADEGTLPVARTDARGRRWFRLDTALAAWQSTRHAGTHGGAREGAGRKPRPTRHPEPAGQDTLADAFAEQDRLAEVSVELERLSPAALQIRERLAKVRRAEREHAEAVGELVAVADVAEATRELLAGLRVGLDALPVTCAAELARVTGMDAAVLEPIVRRAVANVVDAIPAT